MPLDAKMETLITNAFVVPYNQGLVLCVYTISGDISMLKFVQVYDLLNIWL